MSLVFNLTRESLRIGNRCGFDRIGQMPDTESVRFSADTSNQN
ncbi:MULTISPECIES: hypothetical protein [Microvirga]